jgi:hypothetical protein
MPIVRSGDCKREATKEGRGSDGKEPHCNVVQEGEIELFLKNPEL